MSIYLSFEKADLETLQMACERLGIEAPRARKACLTELQGALPPQGYIATAALSSRDPATDQLAERCAPGEVVPDDVIDVSGSWLFAQGIVVLPARWAELEAEKAAALEAAAALLLADEQAAKELDALNAAAFENQRAAEARGIAHGEAVAHEVAAREAANAALAAEAEGGVDAVVPDGDAPSADAEVTADPPAGEIDAPPDGDGAAGAPPLDAAIDGVALDPPPVNAEFLATDDGGA